MEKKLSEHDWDSLKNVRRIFFKNILRNIGGNFDMLGSKFRSEMCRSDICNIVLYMVYINVYHMKCFVDIHKYIHYMQDINGDIG